MITVPTTRVVTQQPICKFKQISQKKTLYEQHMPIAHNKKIAEIIGDTMLQRGIIIKE